MSANDPNHLPAGQHSVVLAFLLSAVCCIAGGQLYNGQYLKAAVFLLGSLLVNSIEVNGFRVVLYAWGILAMVDTVLIANRLNRGEPVGQWQFF